MTLNFLVAEIGQNEQIVWPLLLLVQIMVSEMREHFKGKFKINNHQIFNQFERILKSKLTIVIFILKEIGQFFGIVSTFNTFVYTFAKDESVKRQTN